MPDLIFEWDAAKNDANFRKHGVDFGIAALIFELPVVEAPDTRRDYGETRWIAYGMADGEMYRVVFTRRAEHVVRIISAHKAGRRARQRWLDALQP